MKRLLRTTVRIWLTLAAASLSIVMVQPSVGAPTVKGDAATWAEVVAALNKQQAISHRGRSTVFDKPLIIEFAPPASQHIIIQGKVPEVIPPERITVGNTLWKLDPRSGKWDCAHPEKLEPADLVPLWDRKGEVTATRIPDLVIGGILTHGYAWTATFESGGVPLTINQRLYVGVQTGLPLRAVTVTGKKTSTVDYYDYGAKISITPPCS